MSLEVDNGTVPAVTPTQFKDNVVGHGLGMERKFPLSKKTSPSEDLFVRRTYVTDSRKKLRRIFKEKECTFLVKLKAHIKCQVQEKSFLEDKDVMGILELFLKIELKCQLGDILKSSLSPKNLLAMTVLAKVIEDNDLLKSCSKFTEEYTDVIVSCRSFKLCEMTQFADYLQSCELCDLKKLLLVLTKLALQFSTDSDGNFLQLGAAGEVLEVIEVALSITARYPHIQGLTTYIVKEGIYIYNCVHIAVLAHLYRFEELKLWAEHYIVENFECVIQHISDGDGYRRELMLRYLRLSSLPHVMLLVVDITLSEACGQNITYSWIEGKMRSSNYEIDLTEFEAWLAKLQDNNSDLSTVSYIRGTANLQLDKIIGLFLIKYCTQKIEHLDIFQWLLSQFRKVKAVKTQAIGPEGGTIKLNGCSLIFPKGAVKDVTDITISLDATPGNLPKQGLTIAPILEVKPSLKFEKPVTVKMMTCFRAAGDEEIYATILCKKSGSEWKPAFGCPEILLGKTYGLSFETTHFCKIAPTVSETSTGQFSVKNDIFIRMGTGAITSCFYLHEEDKVNIQNTMRLKKNSPVCPRSLHVDNCRESDELTVHLDLTYPEEDISDSQWTPSNKIPIATLKGRPEGEYSVDMLPRSIVKLKALTHVTGRYEIRIGRDVRECANLSSEWPIQLESLGNITNIIHTILTDHAILTQNKTSCQEYLGGSLRV